MNKKYLNMNIIGSDETGVGDYLTPLVATAAFVPASNVSKLIQMGITDSKKLTDVKILNLFDQVKPLIKYSTRIMSQKQYNFLNKKYNANELKMYLHMKAIGQLEERVDNVDLVILDAFSNDSSLNKYRETLSENEEFKNWKTKTSYVTKGEMEHVSVAVASIVARSFLINEMEKQNKEWETKFPLGTNMIVEEFAKKFIKKNGKDSLYSVAKISFKTTEKIIA